MGGKMSNAYYKDYRSSHKEQRAVISKESMNRCRYGISKDEFDYFLRKQGNACAICKDRFSEESRPYIDHDHSSGWVRGLLCRDCNFAIGLLREDIDRFQSAADYLISTAVPTEFNFAAQKAAVRKPPSCHRRGVILSQTTKDKISSAKVGNSPAWNKGKPWSEETKIKMRKPKRKEYARTEQHGDPPRHK